MDDSTPQPPARASHTPAGSGITPESEPPTQPRGFRHGALAAFSVPGVVLFATSLGYGALARAAELTVAQALTVAAVFYALPAQVVFVDQMARGAGLASAAFLVSLTAIRFLPMTVTMMPALEGRLHRWWAVAGAAHFVSITTWVEAQRRLPSVRPESRLAYFVGIGVGIMMFGIAGTLFGYVAAGVVPRVIAAALLFMTPIYFLLSLLGAAKHRDEGMAIAGGCALGPLFYQIVPGFDLLVTGLVAGTLAYGLGRMRR